MGHPIKRKFYLTLSCRNKVYNFLSAWHTFKIILISVSKKLTCCTKCVGRRGMWAGVRTGGVKRKGRKRIPRMTRGTGKALVVLRIFWQKKWAGTTKEMLGLGSSGSTSSRKRFASSTRKLQSFQHNF